ncbi:MAG: hypothetical protein ACI9XC_000743 [Gammaproteobacteria bacterium]
MVRLNKFIQLIVVIIGAGFFSTAYSQDEISGYRQTLNQYCVSCHNQALKTADLMLDMANLQDLSKDPALWEKVLLKLQTRSMPPVGMPRPDENFYNGLGMHLAKELNALVAANPNAGRTVTAHRLNRTEYSNVVRDLLGVNINAAELLPPDNSGGFDNLGDLLSVSPILMEKYMSVARQVSRLAVGDNTIDADTHQYVVSPFVLQNDRMNEDLPFGTRGGLAVNHRFPLDGEYEISVRLLRTDTGAFVIGVNEPHKLEARIDGKRVDLLTAGGKNVGLALGSGRADTLPPDFDQAQYERNADANLKIRVPVEAGERLVQVAFLEENFAWEGAVPQQSYNNYFTARLQREYERAWTDPSVSSISITGPFNAKGSGDTVSREKIFVCSPKNKKDEVPCAKKIVSQLARIAYRRPVADEDIQPLLSLFETGRSQYGSFEAGIQMAVEGLLVNIDFLFRIESDPRNVAKDSNYELTEHELASRLSFFLWSSIPDDELLTLADQGKLSDSKILQQQVKRMLKDERSESLVNNFAEQWLLLRNLPHTSKNLELFPDFDENLRKDFMQETQLFIGSIFQEDRSILDIFRTDYKFVNERLARHYEIPNVYGNKFRRVNIEDENKKGLLAQGAVLAITSYPNRTSPVLRGKWVLDNLLASPPPPPPNAIPALIEEDDSGKQLTMREAIEKHRANPVCAVCHNRMDPIGFGLENFNPIGQWRTEDAGETIDSSGMLPDGTKFQGPAELQKALLSNPSVIVSAFTQKLLTYALGRDLQYYDMATVRDIVHNSANNDYKFSDIVLGIIKSIPFTMRRTDS